MIICKTRWGLGITHNEKGEPIHYGYPTTKNPHLFFPDPECCTDYEYKQWEEDKKNWKRKGEQ